MDLERKPEKDFLGFAIERMGTRGQWEWLNGLLPFPHMEVPPGQPIPSNVAPIQKFRWTDYTVTPDTQYRYRVHRVSGDPKGPSVEAGPTVAVTTGGGRGDQH